MSPDYGADILVCSVEIISTSVVRRDTDCQPPHFLHVCDRTYGAQTTVLYDRSDGTRTAICG
jgi:hypothetical protein